MADSQAGNEASGALGERCVHRCANTSEMMMDAEPRLNTGREADVGPCWLAYAGIDELSAQTS